MGIIPWRGGIVFHADASHLLYIRVVVFIYIHHTHAITTFAFSTTAPIVIHNVVYTVCNMCEKISSLHRSALLTLFDFC